MPPPLEERRSPGEISLLHMKNEFKRETYYKITADQRHDFLAFAQHHGIPTNLLDFTTSPLIALFFRLQALCLRRKHLRYRRLCLSDPKSSSECYKADFWKRE